MQTIIIKETEKKVQKVQKYFYKLKEGDITYSDFIMLSSNIFLKKIPTTKLFKNLCIDVLLKSEKSDDFTMGQINLNKLFSYIRKLAFIDLNTIYNNILTLTYVFDMLYKDVIYVDIDINPLSIKLYHPGLHTDYNLQIDFEKYNIIYNESIIETSLHKIKNYKVRAKKIYIIISSYIRF